MDHGINDHYDGGEEGGGYSIEFKFDIDDGELYGINSVRCFVLGFELGWIYDMVANDLLPEEMPCHSENRERVEKLFQLNDIEYELVYTDDPEWVLFEFDGKGREGK